MIVQTDYYGEVEYTEQELIIFPDGLLGFPDLKKYLPFYLEENDDSVILLQSTEEPKIAFLVINPVFLCPDYAPRLTKEELAFLKVSDSEELCYYSICVVRNDYLENTVNLKCPLAINPETRTGMQVIMADTPYGCKHKLRSFSSVLSMMQSQEGGGSDAGSET